MRFERTFRTRNYETLYAVVVDPATRQVSTYKWEAAGEPQLVSTLTYDANTGDGDAFAIGREAIITTACAAARALSMDPFADPDVVSERALRMKAEADQDLRLKGLR